MASYLITFATKENLMSEKLELFSNRSFLESTAAIDQRYKSFEDIILGYSYLILLNKILKYEKFAMII